MARIQISWISHILLVGMQNGTATLGNSCGNFFIKLYMYLLNDPASIFLDIYPRGIKTYVHTKIYSQMFMQALLIIPTNWKQPRCPSLGERIDTLWWIHTTEYQSAIKGDTLLIHTTCMSQRHCIM